MQLLEPRKKYSLSLITIHLLSPSYLASRYPVLLGYDVVQYQFIPPYHEGGVAVRGVPELAYNFQGYQFWFSSKKNRNLFVKEPWKYAPAWGGFGSWGMARQYPPEWPWSQNWLGPSASPWTGWLIVDGVLIFNNWEKISLQFSKNKESNFEVAANRWKSFFDGSLHAGPFNTHCVGEGPLGHGCRHHKQPDAREHTPPLLLTHPPPFCNKTISSIDDPFSAQEESALRVIMIAGSVAFLGMVICILVLVRKRAVLASYSRSDFTVVSVDHTETELGFDDDERDLELTHISQ